MAEEYTELLLRIVLHSADVVPQHIKTLFERAKQRGGYSLTKTIFDRAQSISRSMAPEFVDFVIETLFTDDHEDLVDEDYFTSYGISHGEMYLIPTCLSEPFLAVLQANEEEGLRLIKTLTNRATQRWVERVKESQFTPIPIHLEIQTIKQQMWGNAQVYCWFRPRSGCAGAVTAALMALELWLEQQIQLGKEPAELFSKTLKDADCVAMAGVCISVALAYPQVCLRPILPLIMLPRLWMMDVNRRSFDGSRLFDFGFSARENFALQIRSSRESRRIQKTIDVRDLAPSYLFGGDSELSAMFEEQMKSFGTDLPFEFEEERKKPERVARLKLEMEFQRVRADRSIYKLTEVEGGHQVSFELPEALAAISDQETVYSEPMAMLVKLLLSGLSAIQKGVWESDCGIVDAVQFVHKCDTDHVDGLFKCDVAEHKYEKEAAAAVVAAAVFLIPETLKKDGLAAWCRTVLMAASKLRAAEGQPYSHVTLPDEPSAIGAVGLGFLVASNMANDAVREELLRLITSFRLGTVHSVFSGLRNAWDTDEVLCWNAVSLALAVCVPPANFSKLPTESGYHPVRHSWTQDHLNKHIENIRQNAMSDLPTVSPRLTDCVYGKMIGIAISILPVELFSTNSSHRAEVLKMVNDLVKWTVEVNLASASKARPRREEPIEWNSFFGRWLAGICLYLSIDEADQFVLTPIRSTWPSTRSITADFIAGLVLYHISQAGELPEISLFVWNRVSDWILDTLVTDRHSIRFDRSTREAVGLLVFSTSADTCAFEPEWTHATRFTSSIDKWVSAVGSDPQAFTQLLVMLEKLCSAYGAEKSLAWIQECLSSSNQRTVLLTTNDNGERLIPVLIKIGELASGEQTVLNSLGHFADDLINQGIGGAAALKHVLERS